MSYTMEDFHRDLIREGLSEMTPQEILESLSDEQRRGILDLVRERREMIRKMSPQEVLEYMSDDQLRETLKLVWACEGQIARSMFIEERLSSFSHAEIEAYLNRLNKAAPTRKRKKKA